MRHHPKKGQPVKIKNGPHKGRVFLVTDYLEAQYQGKSIDRIKTPLLSALKKRGFKADSDVVFGKFYPEGEFACVHDSELRLSAVAAGGHENSETDSEVSSETSNVTKITRKPRKKKAPDATE